MRQYVALKHEHNYRGSYSAVVRMFRQLRGEQPADVTVRLSFAPAEAAQVDFGAGPILTHPDGPLPEIPQTMHPQNGRERAIAMARRDNLSVRELAQRLGGDSGLAMVGTPATIADAMDQWLESRACDGFNIMFPFLPAGLDDFVDKVVPELRRRGQFRREYEGTTLREHLGLPRPPNRFFIPK